MAGFGFKRGGASDEPLTPEQVWNKLLTWQTRREHTQHELRAKLAMYAVDESLIAQSLAKLCNYGLQDDQRCAAGIVRSQLLRGRGQRAISQRLQQKGLAADHPALAEQTEHVDWVAEATALLHRRFGSAPADGPKAQAKRVRFLQYRGFSLSQAIEAMKAPVSD
ncbi:regulatory protein [Paraperlucidibaca baekdonensis]|uniref:Regulatory protein RecX n=1 Tax=Paraperlucidibaca baekdonensis TaxID=748120 RepID=A0A3E0H3Q5_9GAMM|nr:regulatory protein RecX [Paraperlucidibaca baekdonensis]REH37686.1 regulatory protein [Paraperlucidibaca baekdonensis]